MKILYLILKDKWYDMIDSGKKKEEYREMKDYWYKRLTNFFECGPVPHQFKHFDVVQFRRGYAADAPVMRFEIKTMTEGLPRPEWSDGMKDNHFIIHLGKRLK